MQNVGNYLVGPEEEAATFDHLQLSCPLNAVVSVTDSICLAQYLIIIANCSCSVTNTKM